MADRQEIALLAHLMRRAGFGATRDELEEMAKRSYDATVDQLIDYEDKPPVDDLQELLGELNQIRHGEGSRAAVATQVLAQLLDQTG